MLSWRSEFSDVIPRQIHKRTKYTCHKNSWYRYFSYCSLQHAETFSRKAWLQIALTSNDTLRYRNANKINQSLEYRLCCVLPGYLAFPGSDFTASFSRIGKVNPLKKVRKMQGWSRYLVNLERRKQSTRSKTLRNLSVKCTRRNN